MEKSDEYIDYAAYVRFLAKVTGEHYGASALKKSVLEKAVEKSEMQTLWVIIKKVAFAAAIVIISIFLVIFAVLKRTAYEETHYNTGHDASVHGFSPECKDVDF